MPQVIEIYIKASLLIRIHWSNRVVQWRQSPELIDELAPGGEQLEIVGEFEDTQLESQFSGTNCFS